MRISAVARDGLNKRPVGGNDDTVLRKRDGQIQGIVDGMP
jgi:hypothetical protein